MPDSQPYTVTKQSYSINRHLNISEKLSEFSNIAAIVVILVFAAIYRAKGFDIAGLLVRERVLDKCIRELLVQTLLMIGFSVAVVFSLSRVDLINERQQMMIATDCCVLVVCYQIFCGYSQISRAA